MLTRREMLGLQDGTRLVLDPILIIEQRENDDDWRATLAAGTGTLPTIEVEELEFDVDVTINPGVYAWYDWPEHDDWDVLTWLTGSPADNNTRFARDECGLDYEL